MIFWVESVAVRADVWVYLIFVIDSGESRGRGRLAALLQSLTLFHLRSVPPFRRPVLSLTFPNELLSRFSSLSQTNSLHNHHRHPSLIYFINHSSLVLLLTPITHYVCRNVLSLLLSSFAGASAFQFWEQYFL